MAEKTVERLTARIGAENNITNSRPGPVTVELKFSSGSLIRVVLPPNGTIMFRSEGDLMDVDVDVTPIEQLGPRPVE